MSSTQKKAVIRARALKRRDALSAENRIEMSLVAAQHGCEIDLFSFERLIPGTIIAGFHPIRSEIDPRPLMFELAKRGARLCLPVVTSKTTIEFRELIRGGNMVSTGFGTIGPDESAEVLDPSILLVPLSAYDPKGGRIGYGAGFYDRAIERICAKDIDPLLVGMAFSVQREDDIPMEDHDRYLNGVLTEAGYQPSSI